jgi:hypothetical protein
LSKQSIFNDDDDDGFGRRGQALSSSSFSLPHQLIDEWCSSLAAEATPA